MKKINLVVADMGYGHQRAAYPLLSLADDEILNINNYPGISSKEKKYWENSLKTYDKISRLKKIPLLGQGVFAIMDHFQKIKDFYPNRDLSTPSLQQHFFYRSIRKGLGENLITKLNEEGLPFVSTFFVASYIAEYYNYQGDIYTVVCDADISRAWAPLNPKTSRIKFLAPNQRVAERLLMYGVKENNIIITGFPLPKENVGDNKEILKADLLRRLQHLDPHFSYRKIEKSLLENIFSKNLNEEFDFNSGPELSSNQFKFNTRQFTKTKGLSITFAVGGAGAQKEMAVIAIKQLKDLISLGIIKFNLIAGNRSEVAEYFKQELNNNNLEVGQGVQIIYQDNKIDYFKEFNQVLRETDILWTKPSELSFYSGLGLPILMAPTIGSQETYNRSWLLNIGAGVDNLNPEHIREWLAEMINSGRLARAAVAGYLYAESFGTRNIQNIFK